MKKRELSESERHVIIDKGTEMPFSGKYWNNRQPGTYVCRQCGTPLYRSADKFDAGCGWPSFDDAIPGAVIRRPMPTAIRTRNRLCGLRRPSRPRLYRRKIHPEEHPPLRQFHIVGIHSGDTVRSHKRLRNGCFRRRVFLGCGILHAKGTRRYLRRIGAIRRQRPAPSYEEVCSDRTGHAEAVRVTFDPTQTTYEALARLFFEIHDRNRSIGRAGHRQAVPLGNLL